jgi:hypothetical protein
VRVVKCSVPEVVGLGKDSKKERRDETKPTKTIQLGQLNYVADRFGD